jgi:alginate O-acetyltransferase complex protein AlgI
MLFTDSFFLFYFLPAALFSLFLAAAIRPQRGYSTLSKALLFCLTIAFYGFQEVWWLVPFFVCLCLSWVWVQLLERIEQVSLRRAVLALSVAQSLGLLGLFKYWPFIHQNLVGVFPRTAEWLPQLLMDQKSIVLPAGISFYTFESLSFVIDVYRKQVAPPKNPLDFICFMAMFPRFVAGPIVRYREIASQFSVNYGMQLEKGFILFAAGFCLKTLFADHFGLFAQYAFENDGTLGFVAAWVGLFSYTLQIYFDFSGYSLMAIGLGWCLGFEFPDNFNRPYCASSLQDFWRKWHISLSRWLRDYLYTSLGGSRKGPYRTYGNLFLTMVLGGLWHGSGWTFLLWGAWHGGWLVLERRFPSLFPRSQIRTFLLVMLGWVFFRAKDLTQARVLFSALLNPLVGITSFNFAGLEANYLSLALCAIGVLYCFCLEPQLKCPLTQAPTPCIAQRALLGAVFVFALIVHFSSVVIPFLYFQF